MSVRPSVGLWSRLAASLGRRQSAVRWGRRDRRRPVAAETLEARAMLSAPSVFYITATDGADVSVDGATAGVDKVVVASTARIGELSITGSDADLRVTIAEGAVVGNIDYVGSAGRDSLWVRGQVAGEVRMWNDGIAHPVDKDDTFVLASSGRTGRLNLILSAGHDRIIVTGRAEVVDDRVPHAVRTQSGDDRVAFVGAEIVGRLFIEVGFDQDRVAIRDTTVSELLYIAGYHGSDDVRLTRVQAGEVDLTGYGTRKQEVPSTNRYGITDLTVTGDLFILGDDLGRSREEITFAGRTEVGGDMRMLLGRGDDKVSFAETVVGGNQELLLGTSETFDSVRFGNDTIGGSSWTTSWESLRATETTARLITGEYGVDAGGGDSYRHLSERPTGDETTMIRLDAGSTAAAAYVSSSLRGRSFVSVTGITAADRIQIGVDGEQGTTVLVADLTAAGAIDLAAGREDPALLRIAGRIAGDLQVWMGHGDDELQLRMDSLTPFTIGSVPWLDGRAGIDRITGDTFGAEVRNFEL